MQETLKRIFNLEDGVLSWTSYFVPLLTRIVVGYSMWIDGKGKLEHPERPLQLFSSLFIPFTDIPIPHPELQVAMISNLEYYGGLLLVFGLLTRPVAGVLAGAMAGAILMADSGELIQKWSDGVPTDATSFTLFLFCLWLLIFGAGPISVDGAIGWVVRHWANRAGSLQPHLKAIISGWVVRGWIALVLLALCPVAEKPDEFQESEEGRSHR